MSHAASTIASHLANAQSGSRDAIGVILEAFRPYLTKVARHNIGPDLAAKGGASDIVQETFLEAVRDFGHFGGSTESELRAWLRCLLTHHVAKLRRCYRVTQKRSLSRETPLGDDSGSAFDSRLASGHTSPSGRAVAHEQVRAVEAAVARLPADYREVVRLRYREQKSLDEIAAVMGRSPSAVTMLWFRAVRRIREEFGAEL